MRFEMNSSRMLSKPQDKRSLRLSIGTSLERRFTLRAHLQIGKRNSNSIAGKTSCLIYHPNILREAKTIHHQLERYLPLELCYRMVLGVGYLFQANPCIIVVVGLVIIVVEGLG